MLFLKLVYPILFATMIGLGWFGIGLPYMISAKSDELPIIGIIATPLVLVAIAFLVMITVKTVKNTLTNKQ